MEKNIFRKNAVDKVKSPEQLNEYIKVAGSGVWSILGGFIIIFAAFIVWGFFGSIPETVSVDGTALSSDGKSITVYCYFPIDEAQRLSEGMEVWISPNYAPKEQFGYIYGTIKSVGKTPVSEERLRSVHGDDFAFLVIPSGNIIEVIVEPEEEEGVLKWSAAKGASVTVTAGSICELTIITAQRKPYDLFFR